MEIIESNTPIVPDAPTFHDDDIPLDPKENLIAEFDTEETLREDILTSDKEDGVETLTGSNELPSINKHIMFKERNDTVDILHDDNIKMFLNNHKGHEDHLLQVKLIISFQKNI